MSLPLAQSRVLRFVADTGPATARQVEKGLRMDHDTAKNALTLLDGKGLVFSELSSWPTSYTVTDAGKEALAAEDGA